MKNELLTIGNIVELQGTQYTVTGIEKSKAFDCDMVTLDEWLRVEMSEIKGVVITDEWLFKLRFEKDKYQGVFWRGFNNKPTALKSAEINQLDNGDWHVKAKKRYLLGGMNDIKYIHQLQNLIYVLIGETLEITP